MSSKLVRKGLEFVCSNEATGSKRKTAAAAHGVKKRSKQKARRQGKQVLSFKPRKGMNSAGETKKAAVDYTERNLEYFRGTSWGIDKDTYNKIMERNKKKSRQPIKEDSQPQEEDSEAEEFSLE